jgi:hypothetical protein
MLAALVTEYALWLVEFPQGSTGAPTFLGSWSQTGLRAVALLAFILRAHRVRSCARGNGSALKQPRLRETESMSVSDGVSVERIVIELETPGDSRSLFRLRLGNRVVGENLTAVQGHLLVGEILDRITLPRPFAKD